MIPVPTRRFGRTELAMPVLTCGGMRYQESWKDEDWDKISDTNQENLAATVHRALSAGINHIETARGYGTSERQLGRVLPALSREKLIIQTKVGPAPAAEYLKTFDRSMDLLGIEHVDLLAIHGINNDELLDQTLAPGGALEAARQIQRDGRARFIGFSTHASCATIARALATSEFDYVNLHWYWINQSNWPAIEEATRQEGIPEWTAIPGGVNVWEILRLWTCATALDMTAFAKMRYNLLGQGGHWFPGKNASEFEETAVRSVLTASPFRDRIPSILREAHQLLFEAPVERLGKDE